MVDSKHTVGSQSHRQQRLLPLTSDRLNGLEEADPRSSVDLNPNEKNLYSLAGLSSIEISTDYLSSLALYNSSHGYYLTDVDGAPISGQVIAANIKEAEDKTVRIDLRTGSEAAYLGFFIIPNGARENSNLGDGDEISFEFIDGKWTPTLDGEALKGIGAPALFTDTRLNPDGFEHAQDSDFEGNQNWEDQLGGGDEDFSDANLNLVVKGYQASGDVASETGSLILGSKEDDILSRARWR